MYPDFFSSLPATMEPLFRGTRQPWEALDRLQSELRELSGPSAPPNLPAGVVIQGVVRIGEGTVIEPGVVMKGPAIIGNNCEIRSGAYIRGFVITGDRCVIGHSTELIRCLLMDNVRADHFNYISDSIIGNGVHFGAGAKVANLRFDKKEIIIDGQRTGRVKFGVVFGDRCQLGVNVAVGPGVLFQQNCWWTLSGLLPSGTYTRERLQQRRGV